MFTRRLSGMISMVLLVVAAGGCDTGLGPRGDADLAVRVAGESGAGGRSSADRSEAVQAGSSGTVEIRARVHVRTAEGTWREVTRGWTRQEVALDGSDGGKLLVRGRLNAGRYTSMRVEFERVEARLDGGAWIGGLPGGEVRVEVRSGGQIVVEREMTLELSSGSETRVTVALNPARWLSRVAAETSSVSEAEFRSAVEIRLD